MIVKDAPKIAKRWKICRYNSHADYLSGSLPDFVIDAAGRELPGVSVIHENVLLDEGVTALLNLLTGAAETNFGNANAYLGVGNASSTALTGTITVTNGSTSVSGSGTAFTTQLKVGSLIMLDADALWVEVESITNDDNLVLTANYSGTGGTGSGAFITANASDTGLVGTTEYQPMEATYPQISGRGVTWRAVFTGTEANFDWLEFTVANGNSNAADNLNRRLSNQGTKASGQTWTADLTITFLE